MTKRLCISNDLLLPIDAATQTFAFIARKGAGKTYAAGRLAECLLDAGVQVVVLDLVGNWWGLRLMANGRDPAFDIPVVGGLRGDIPLEPTGGSLIADILTDTGRSMIVDISQFSKQNRQRFAHEFGERLWKNKKAERRPTPLHLIIEESQLIVPERFDAGAAAMVGIYEEIIRLGRNFGIGVTMISQRPQSVNKEVLNQTECLFALQVNGAHERAALKGWIVHHGADANLVNELPDLPVGVAYVWSPQWLRILKKVKIGEKKTFDASATPKVGSANVRRDLKPLDLDDLKQRMSETIEKAQANDPKLLHKRIAELETSNVQLERVINELKDQPPPQCNHVEELSAIRAKLSECASTYEAAIENGAHALESITKGIQDASTQLTETLLKHRHTFSPDVAGNWEAWTKEPLPTRKPALIIQTRIHENDLASRAKDAYSRPGGLGKAGWLQRTSENGLKTGPKAILESLIQFPDGLTKPQLKVLCAYKATSLYEYLKILVANGLAEKTGELYKVTSDGRFTLPDVAPAPTGPALRQFWTNRLSEGESKLLDMLIDTYPRTLSKTELSERTGYKATSTYEYLKKLKARSLVTGDASAYKATETLF